MSAAVRATRARSSVRTPARTGTAASSETSIMEPSSQESTLTATARTITASRCPCHRRPGRRLALASRPRPGLLQELVDEGDGHAALADRGGHPLHRAAADVAAGEDAGDAGLEEVRVAALSPAAGLHHGVSGEQVA